MTTHDDRDELEDDPPQRIALVLDIAGLRHVAAQHEARAALEHTTDYLTARNIRARPVRVDINGHTTHIAGLGR